MRDYLDLIRIQEKANRKQSRMTRICIFLSVLLIMGLFGMADMEIRSETIQAVQQYGSWHALFRELTQEQAAILAGRPEIAASARLDSCNVHLEEGWQIEGTRTAICGFDESLGSLHPAGQITEGSFPSKETQIACSDSVRDRLGLSVGDELTIHSPDGESFPFTISGFFRTTSMLTRADAFGVYVNTDSYRKYFYEEGSLDTDLSVFVVFRPFCRIQKAIADICEQMEISEDQVGQNAMLLGLRFQSRDPYLLQLYLVVAVIACLVAAAGILMITGSLNSSVAQRTEFFGMMRCLGATPGQVARFMHL